MQNTLCSAKVMHIPEILDQGIRLNGDSVRVIGKLIEFNFQDKIALLEYSSQNLSVCVSCCSYTKKWEIQSYYQFIGELDFSKKVGKAIFL